MRTIFGVEVVLAFFLICSSNGARVWAQSASGEERVEMGANYSFVHTNAPPGDCGCFSMNGGAGWFAYNFTRGLAGVGEVGSVHASNIDGTTAGLTITSYLVGPRYSRQFGKMLVPFAQVLLGGARADGELTFVRFGVAQPANSFALTAGGGLDIGITRHWAVRAGQVDYLLTRFSNGVNDHQNNLRVSAGIIYRVGGKKK
jgi:outer membrane immunogenic protein